MCRNKADWIVIYYKESYILKKNSTGLILVPFLGEPTEHVRISLNRGICGMALREERIVNINNVHDNPHHIACNVYTNSELVIPLKNKVGKLIAELDINSNKKSAFDVCNTLGRIDADGFPVCRAYH